MIGFKAKLVAGARFSSNFNTEPPTLVVQIPVNAQQRSAVLKRPEPAMLGVQLMAEAGYDPEAMIEVMPALSAQGKSGRQPGKSYLTDPRSHRKVKAALKPLE